MSNETTQVMIDRARSIADEIIAGGMTVEKWHCAGGSYASVRESGTVEVVVDCEIWPAVGLKLTVYGRTGKQRIRFEESYQGVISRDSAERCIAVGVAEDRALRAAQAAREAGWAAQQARIAATTVAGDGSDSYEHWDSVRRLVFDKLETSALLNVTHSRYETVITYGNAVGTCAAYWSCGDGHASCDTIEQVAERISEMAYNYIVGTPLIED